MADIYDTDYLAGLTKKQYENVNKVQWPWAADKKEFTQLLKQAIAFAGNDTSNVFVLSIPDYGFTPFGSKNKEKIGEEIDQFNAACKAITESMNVSFYNITDISRKAEEQPALVAKDNLHPSGKMYRLWMERIQDKILKKLQ